MSWLRINRWWLLAFPLSVIVVVVGSSDRVKGQWYEQGLHRRVASASDGHYAEATMHNVPDYTEPQRFDVRLVGLTTADKLPPDFLGDPQPIPSSKDEALVAKLDWKAEPDQILTDCHVQLIDDQGRRYEERQSMSDLYQCVPAHHPGPDLTSGKHLPKSDVRPASWSTAPTFLVPKGIRITSVLIYWTLPYYVELRAS